MTAVHLDLYPGLPEYEKGILTTKSGVKWFWDIYFNLRSSTSLSGHTFPVLRSTLTLGFFIRSHANHRNLTQCPNSHILNTLIQTRGSQRIKNTSSVQKVFKLGKSTTCFISKPNLSKRDIGPAVPPWPRVLHWFTKITNQWFYNINWRARLWVRSFPLPQIVSLISIVIVFSNLSHGNFSLPYTRGFSTKIRYGFLVSRSQLHVQSCLLNLNTLTMFD